MHTFTEYARTEVAKAIEEGSAPISYPGMIEESTTGFDFTLFDFDMGRAETLHLSIRFAGPVLMDEARIIARAFGKHVHDEGMPRVAIGFETPPAWRVPVAVFEEVRRARLA